MTKACEYGSMSKGFHDTYVFANMCQMRSQDAL